MVAFNNAKQGLSDFYWLLRDQNIHTAGIGLTDNAIYLGQNQEPSKNILDAIAAAEVDAAIIVVDCLNGLQEQTREHIKFFRYFILKKSPFVLRNVVKILIK